jgi:hypothetical protein
MNRFQKWGAGLSLAMTPLFASAQAIDITGVSTQITAAATAVLAIGAAVVAGPKIAVKVYKWVGRAL